MIIACPACDARYELDDAQDGKRGRCRCGTEFTIHAPPQQAGMLACPKCGAAVPESSSTCAYCAAPLLVKACPRCLARVFEGHKHCPECGAGLDAPAAATSTRTCPRCHVPLATHMVGDVAIDDCAQCGGSFVDRPTIERLLSERRAARATEILGVYGDGGEAPLPQQQTPMYVKCPDCAQFMNRKQFATGARVVVDVCRAHGTWFDAHELPRVVRFVMSGGLDEAAKRDLAEEEARARQMMNEAKAAKTQAQWSAPANREYGSLIADVLFQLWK